jgi:hypothetical protein
LWAAAQGRAGIAMKKEANSPGGTYASDNLLPQLQNQPGHLAIY